MIGCEDRLRNDLYGVEWGVKLYSVHPRVRRVLCAVAPGRGDGGLSSRCEELRDAEWTYPGAYRPQCTPDGEFEPLQCHAGTGECWCVGRDGQEIPGTIRRGPRRPDCSQHGMIADVALHTVPRAHHRQ